MFNRVAFDFGHSTQHLQWDHLMCDGNHGIKWTLKVHTITYKSVGTIAVASKPQRDRLLDIASD